MAIEIQSQLITVPGAQLTTSDSGVIYGMFANESFTTIYVVVRDATNRAEMNWKKIDITNPGSPAVSNWTVADISHPVEGGVSDAHGNGFFYNTADGYVYGVFFTGGALCLLRITISSGLVEYNNKQFAGIGGAAPISTAGPVLGVAIIGTNLYSLLPVTGGVMLFKWPFSNFGTWSSVFNPSGGFAFATSEFSVKQGSQPTPASGLTVSQDGNLLVFFDTTNTCSKYLASNCVFSGTTAFPVADIGTAFSRNGYIYQTNQNFFTTTDLTIQRWLDRSTAVISQDKSLVTMPDRIVQIAENTSLAVTFKARDGFGAPMSALSGLNCRFHVVTNRGTIDGDDAAVAASSVGPFRDGNDVPILRQVDVPFNGSGEATAYFQSARRASAQNVEDIVRITYPPA